MKHMFLSWQLTDIVLAPVYLEIFANFNHEPVGLQRKQGIVTVVRHVS